MTSALVIHIIITLVSLLLTIVAFDFRCPDLEQSTACKCRGELEWWNNRNVSIVNCSFSNLHRIPKLSVLEDYEITKLLLKGNNVTELSLNDFITLQISEIDLSRNPIGQLANETLSSLSRHLKRLALEGSEIILDRGLWFLRDLEQLEELILDSNIIKNEYHMLPGAMFRDLRLNSLRRLSLKSCSIGKIAQNSFVGLESLEELDLSYNDLEQIPEAIKQLKNLKKLVLYGNSISMVTNGSFRGLHELEEIDLDVNEVSIVETGAFDGLENSLKELKLHYNDFSNIPANALRKLKKLHFLVLSRNNIQFINRNTFVGMPSLRVLELDNNRLIYYNEMFSGLENTIETITLRSTELTTFPYAALKPLKKLSDLDLSFNKITDPRNIGKLKLKSLALANNGIVSIHPSAFDGLVRPIGLDLDNNAIKNISFILDVKPCSFSYMDLVGNPVACDCNTEKVVNSGMILALRGECTFQDGVRIDISSSKVTRQLSTMCNKTDRTYSCQNFQYFISRGSRNDTYIYACVVVLVLFLFM